MVVWSGKTQSYHHKWNTTPNPEYVDKGFKKVWMLDAQWSDCPVEVAEEVIKVWQSRELGNDNYIINTSLENLEEAHNDFILSNGEEGENWEVTLQYIKEQAPDLDKKDTILIYYWW